MDYKNTLNLPKTAFPMKADLATREPIQVARWLEQGIYDQMLAAREGRPRFVLHDGPPYANGNIHFGHILNKVLKDIVVKSKAMAGLYTPFIPGWDCHGLPIELQAIKERSSVASRQSPEQQSPVADCQSSVKTGTGDRRPATGDDVLAVRRACRAYAEKYVAIQRTEFQRIGCFAAWDHPYRTMDFAYEAAILHEFATFVAKGSVTTGLKPIHWCASCRTALAEAEVEYENHTSPSIYVKFRLQEEAKIQQLAGGKNLPVFCIIWTTTPWTIPANLGLAFHPEYPYVVVEVQSPATSDQRPATELWILAEGLLDATMSAIGITDYTVRAHLRGAMLERCHARHPLIDRDSLIMLGTHVTLDAGTGIVHTAPGHGQDDFRLGQLYGLETFAPVDAVGRYTPEVGIEGLAGQSVWKANPVVVDRLRDAGTLVHAAQLDHQYPHCWRCKKPIIFRATEQWFIGMEHQQLRERALAAISTVHWIPAWGRNRIEGMIANRPDWCISRQRAWGVPIVAVYCEGCGRRSTSEAFVRRVAEHFATDGADAWFARDLGELLPPHFVCIHCGRPGPFRKETDILDVWFDSGVSFAAVCEAQAQIPPPVDLYLEGSDQHRGWFHSALLIGIGTRDMAPYRAVLTHGFVVDQGGRKYSKSAKNYVPPESALQKYGAEVLRLWVAAEDYRNDIRVSDEILNRCADSYRKIRNTWRFLLGNLYDFDPGRDAVPEAQWTELDRWIVARCDALVARCRTAYETYELHVVYHAVNAFCTVDCSAFYLDIVKDRLYCEAATGPLRRSAQTVIWHVADALTRLVAPILSFTAEEVWQYLPKPAKAPTSVFAADLPAGSTPVNADLLDRWERLQVIRGEAAKILETARKEKTIGSALEARLTIQADDATQTLLRSLWDGLADFFIVSEVTFGAPTSRWQLASEVVKGLTIGVERMSAPKCARCWKFAATVGSNARFPDVCARCAAVLTHYYDV